MHAQAIGIITGAEMHITDTGIRNEFTNTCTKALFCTYAEAKYISLNVCS